MEYCQMEAMAKIGFRSDIGDLEDDEREIYMCIAAEFAKLEAEAHKKAAKQSRSRAKSGRGIRRR